MPDEPIGLVQCPYCGKKVVVRMHQSVDTWFDGEPIEKVMNDAR